MEAKELYPKVMIVDDCRSIANTIGFILEAEKYRIIKCYNGKEAIEALVEDFNDPPKLIITDFRMPEMNGVELFYNIQEIPVISKYKIPIIILTGTPLELPAFPSRAPAAIIDKSRFGREKLLNLVNRLVWQKSPP